MEWRGQWNRLSWAMKRVDSEVKWTVEYRGQRNVADSTMVWAGGGGGTKKNLNPGRLRPEVRPLTILYTIFGRKGTPFVYLPLENNERPF